MFDGFVLEGYFEKDVGYLFGSVFPDCIMELIMKAEVEYVMYDGADLWVEVLHIVV